MKELLGLVAFLMMSSIGPSGKTINKSTLIKQDGVQVRQSTIQSQPKRFASGDASIGDIVPFQDGDYMEDDESKAYLVASIDNGPLSDITITPLSGQLYLERIVSIQSNKVEFMMNLPYNFSGNKTNSRIRVSGKDTSGKTVSKEADIYVSVMNGHYCISTVCQEQADMLVALDEWSYGRISTTQFDLINTAFNAEFIDYSTSTYGSSYYTFNLKEDDSRTSPLKYVAVGCLNSSGNVLATLQTDTEGRIYKSYIPSGTDHLRIYSFSKLSSSNEVVRVEKTRDFYNSYYYQDIYLESNGYGKTITINTKKNNKPGYLGRALQVLRPLIFGAKYVQDMSGSLPGFRSAVYPHKNGCYFNGDAICLTDYVYNYPDITLHEYGHHLQGVFNLAGDFGGIHYVHDYSLKENYKAEGLRLTWGEAWPTVFGTLVGQYFPGEFNNYSGIDSSYNDQGWSSDLETLYDGDGKNVRYGEGCEDDVMAVLYDLYDPYNEPHDHFSLGHQGLWNLMIGAAQSCTLRTFDDFAKYFIAHNSFDDINGFGKLMAEYGFSPDPIVEGTGTPNQSPLIHWRKTNTRYDQSWNLLTDRFTYSSNRYEITFFDGWRSTLFTRTTTSESYTLNSSDWATLMAAYGSCYYIRVKSFQENGNRNTGGYNSDLILVSKPKLADLTGYLSWNPSNRLVNRSINLGVGQSIVYDITVSRSDDTVFQTVGNEGIRMYLYDNNYHLLAQTGLHSGYHAHGYSYNGFIRYYCQTGVTYKLKLESFDSSYAINNNKLLVCQPLAFTQDWRPYNSPMDLDDINHDNFTYGLWCDRYKVSLFNYTPVASGKHTVELSSEFDTYCYVIDTYTAEIFYDDDSGSGLNAKVTINNMVGGRKYLIAFSQYNPNSALPSNNGVSVHMWKN